MISLKLLNCNTDTLISFATEKSCQNGKSQQTDTRVSNFPYPSLHSFVWFVQTPPPVPASSLQQQMQSIQINNNKSNEPVTTFGQGKNDKRANLHTFIY